MDFKLDPKIQKVLGVTMAVGAGLMAVINTLTEQKKDQEFEDMKRDIAELKENKGDS